MTRTVGQMTVRDVLRDYPHEDTELLLAHALARPREFLFLEPGYRSTARQRELFLALYRKRLKGWPAAYLLGYRDFYGLRFWVDRNVLIPRPESEWLVERAAGLLKARRTPAAVLDVGTGSGCLVVSLARSAGRRHRYFATDVSQGALKVARKNARRFDVSVRFAKVPYFPKKPERFDLVLANLPYVPVSDYRKFKAGLGFEPQAAITDGTDRFAAIERLLQRLSSRLSPSGVALLEIDPTAKPLVARWARRYLLGARVSFTRDLRGLWRYAEVTVR